MASLTYESKTRIGYRLQAYAPGDSSRRFSVWLGDVSAREAETIRRHVEAVIESQQLGTPMPGETLRWMERLSDAMRRKLTPVFGRARSVRQAVDDYLAWASRQHKDSTVYSTTQTLEQFADHFGSRQMRALAGDEVDQFLRSRNVSSNTVAKMAKHLKTWIGWAKRAGLVDDLRISVSSAIGVGTKHFLSVDQFDALFATMRGDAEMQAALAIARWAGVRVPSEILLLTRASVDWDKSTLLVVDSKRRYRASRGPPIVRNVPLFPELVPFIESIWSCSEHPTDSLLPSVVAMGGANFVARCRAARDEAGMSWPRLFSSVRATRETELITRFGLKAACEWIGNSPAVAIKHYELITAETWKEAVGELGPSTTRHANDSR